MEESQEKAEYVELVREAKRGEAQAFEELVKRYKEVVFATVVAIVNDLDAAQDIAQETFVRAWFGIRGLDDAGSFGGWLRTIARNRSLTWIERRGCQPQWETMEPDQLADGGRSPEDTAEQEDRNRVVRHALQRISPTSREVLVLHYMEDMTTPRMAAMLGIAQPTVRQRLRRARLEIKEEMENMVADAIRDDAPGKDFTNGVNAMLEHARGLFGKVRYGHAVPVLESAREQDPEDTFVSMILAEAYTFACVTGELESDNAWPRALALFDEVLEREPKNMLARLRRASLRWRMTPDDDVDAEQRELVEETRGSAFEAVTQLEVTRAHLTRGESKRALAELKTLESKFPWMECVLQSEMGVACAMSGDGVHAKTYFKRAVTRTTPAAMDDLRAKSAELMGEGYWAFWRTVDNLPVRQCQNHSWLAGLSANAGNMSAACGHVKKALAHLDDAEVGEARDVLRREFVRRMEQMFPDLAAQEEVQELRQELDDD